MQNLDRKRIYPKNPVGIIALFVFFIEVISVVSLKFILEFQSAYTGHMIWFIILFPSTIVLLFFVTLWFRREGLYSPADFRNDESFLSLFKKVEKLEVIQQASQIDPRSSSRELISMIKKLVEQDEIYAAVHLARAPLKIGNFDSSLECFTFLMENVSKTHDEFTAIQSNFAYSLIGKNQYQQAIEVLTEIASDPTVDLDIWQLMALAYSYFKLGNEELFKNYFQYATGMKEFNKNKSIFEKLYPEIINK